MQHLWELYLSYMKAALLAISMSSVCFLAYDMIHSSYMAIRIVVVVCITLVSYYLGYSRTSQYKSKYQNLHIEFRRAEEDYEEQRLKLNSRLTEVFQALETYKKRKSGLEVEVKRLKAINLQFINENANIKGRIEEVIRLLYQEQRKSHRENINEINEVDSDPVSKLS